MTFRAVWHGLTGWRNTYSNIISDYLKYIYFVVLLLEWTIDLSVFTFNINLSQSKMSWKQDLLENILGKSPRINERVMWEISKLRWYLLLLWRPSVEGTISRQFNFWSPSETFKIYTSRTVKKSMKNISFYLSWIESLRASSHFLSTL